MSCRSSLIDRLIASTRHSGKPISPGRINRTICVGPNCWMISWIVLFWNCDHRIWLIGNWRLIWKSPNVCLAIWCHRCSPRCNVISQQIFLQRWECEFFCILHNILLVCPCLCWYYIPWQCLINFSTALENAQFLPVMCTPQVVNDCFLPAMCTPQNKWIKRARSVLEVLCASPQIGLCHIQDLWLWHGGTLHVWASRLINQKRLLLVSVGINIIWSVGNEYVKLS